MTLIKIQQLNPNYREQFNGRDPIGMEVFSDLTAGVLASQTRERLGAVSDILVDEIGTVQYFVLGLGSSGTGRTVLLPSDRAYIDYDADRVFASGFTKEEAEQLPPFDLETKMEDKVY